MFSTDCKQSCELSNPSSKGTASCSWTCSSTHENSVPEPRVKTQISGSDPYDSGLNVPSLLPCETWKRRDAVVLAAAYNFYHRTAILRGWASCFFSYGSPEGLLWVRPGHSQPVRDRAAQTGRGSNVTVR